MICVPFTCNEIKQRLNRLKKGKYADPDLILNEFIKCSAIIEFIKCSASSMILTLVKLFNKVLLSRKFPDCWNHSLLASVYKSGDPTDCNNYRGISCLGKLFTSLLERRLNNYLETNDILSIKQGGFRKNYRTTDHVFILKTLINKYIQKCNNKLYVCFVDVRKAFDSVWRSALLSELQTKGIG